MRTHACSPCTLEIQAGKSVQGHTWFHGKLKVTLGYMAYCFKQMNK